MTRFLSFGEHFKCVICYPPNICDSLSFGLIVYLYLYALYLCVWVCMCVFVGGCLCHTISSFSRAPFSSCILLPFAETDSSSRLTIFFFLNLTRPLNFIKKKLNNFPVYYAISETNLLKFLEFHLLFVNCCGVVGFCQFSWPAFKAINSFIHRSAADDRR